MTRKELAEAIYDAEEAFAPHKCSKAEWVRRALNGCGAFKGFTKAELEAMYARKVSAE